MKSNFDVVIIGSGPTAIATLLSLDPRLKVAVITGAVVPDKGASKHPKILTVAKINGEMPGAINYLPFREHTSGELFETSIVGGLANYWGQQFLPYMANDPWPRHLFIDHKDYLDCCDKILKLFILNNLKSKNKNITLFSPKCAYRVSKPSLVLGVREDLTAGLDSMRLAFQSVTQGNNVRIFNGAVKRINKVRHLLAVELSNGEIVNSQKIIVTAGVVSSLRLIMRSCNDLKSVRFKDHSPVMLYYFDKRGLFANFDEMLESNFNRLTFEKQEKGNVRLFASLYQLSYAPFGLLLSSVGFPPLLSNLKIPKIFDFIRPIQVWTRSSYVQYQMHNDHNTVFETRNYDRSQDVELAEFKKTLQHHGLILYQSSTQPGYGFHYHGGQVSFDDNHFTGLAEFMGEYYDNKAACLDASSMDEIGVRPHTLTAMACAYRSAERFLALK